MTCMHIHYEQMHTNNLIPGMWEVCAQNEALIRNILQVCSTSLQMIDNNIKKKRVAMNSKSLFRGANKRKKPWQ